MKLFSTTWRHIRRSPYQAMAAILTLFLTFLLGGMVFLTSTVSVFVLSYFESKPQITVFFADKATKDDAMNLTKTLEGTGKVASTKYISKDDALALYRQQNKSDPLLLEMVTADILPASLEVSAKDPSFLKDLEPTIRSASGVEEVVFQKDVVDTLLAWTNAIRIVGGAVAGILAIDSILIIVTVIGMKIAIRREEIEILRLVGASPWYIRMPFIMEGGMYGAVGAFVSWIIITGIVVWARPMIVGFLGMIPVISLVLSNMTSTPFLIASGGFLGSMLIVGFLLGAVGSLLALSRYLKI